MEEKKNIYETIIGIMREVPAIGKSKTNKTQNFKYRGIDDVMNALNPLMSKYGLFIAPKVIEKQREERTTKTGSLMTITILTIQYTFYAADGSSIDVVIVGEGMDTADKSTNKAMAIGMKYALFQVFCIPTEEMSLDDPDRITPEEIIPEGVTPQFKPKKITYNRRQKIVDKIKELGIANETVLGTLKVHGFDKLADVTEDKIDEIEKEITNK